MSADLAGRRILVTRPDESGKVLVRQLEAAGARVFHHPAIRVEPGGDRRAVLAALNEVTSSVSGSRLLLTSRNGLIGAIHVLGHEDAARLPRSVWCAGVTTADAAAKAGLEPRVVAARGGMQDLVRRVLEDDPPNGLVVLWPRGDLADENGVSPFVAAGATVIEAVVYRTIDVYATGGPPSDAVLDLIDTAVFASPSAVQNLMKALDPARAEELRRRLLVVAIGPTTTAALERAGFEKVRTQATANPFDPAAYF